jgi:hypothetical protein
LGPLTEQSKLDLQRRLGIPADKIELGIVKPFTWGDTSFGCPQAGVEYPMAIISGYIIILHVAGQSYEYHTDRTDRIVFCGGKAP